MAEIINLNQTNEEKNEDFFGEETNANDLLAIDNKKKKNSGGESSESQSQEFEFTEDRVNMIHKIEKYKDAFPDACRLVQIDLLHNLSDEELKEYLQKIRYTVSSRNCSNLIHRTIDGGIYMGEKVLSNFYPQVSGTHLELNANPEYHDLLKEISIEYNVMKYVPPEYRLCMLVGGTVLRKINTPVKVVPKPEEEKPKEIPKEIADKYKDL